jgi:hypothetical protein
MKEVNKPKKATSCCICNCDGWYWEDYGGCGDPECCGSPIKKKCYNCENDYKEEDD